VCVLELASYSAHDAREVTVGCVNQFTRERAYLQTQVDACQAKRNVACAELCVGILPRVCRRRLVAHGSGKLRLRHPVRARTHLRLIMPVVQQNILLKLPDLGAKSDADLKAAATRIFQAAPVWSVTFDAKRTTAAVKLLPTKREDSALQAQHEAALASLVSVLAQPAAETMPPMELLSWTDLRDQSISFIPMPVPVRGWRKALYLALAGIALTLALIGIVLPGLPTTPFVLLGSYFLLRSSKLLHERLMASRLVGGVLRDWHVHRGLRPHVRARAVAVVALVVAASLLLARPSLAVVLVILSLALCGLLVIWKLPSVGAAEVLNRGE